MKARLTKVSLALLSTVFLLGCQDMGSGPVGLEGPQFDKKGVGDCGPVGHDFHCHEGSGGDNPDVIYLGTFTVDLKTFVPIEFGGNLQASSAGNQLDFYMDLSFFGDDEVVPDGSTCFSNLASTLILTLVITPSKQDPASASVLITFDALGTDGTPDVNYGLSLAGEVTGKLPPDLGESVDITWGTFRMNHNNGPGKKVACDGTGTLSSFTMITAVTP